MHCTHKKSKKNRRNQGRLRWAIYSECMRVEIKAVQFWWENKNKRYQLEELDVGGILKWNLK